MKYCFFMFQMAQIKTSRDTYKFLIGAISDKLPDNQLPTGRDVLRFLFHKKSVAGVNKQKPKLNPLVCCPMKSGLKEANCDSCDCMVRAVKIAWKKAGFETMSDFAISEKIKKTGFVMGCIE